MALPITIIVRLDSCNGNQCSNPQSTLVLQANSNPPAYYDDGNGDFDTSTLVGIGSPITNWELRITYDDPNTTCSLNNAPFRMPTPPAGVVTDPTGLYYGWVNGATNANSRQAVVTAL